MRDSIKKAIQRENNAHDALTAAGFHPWGDPFGGVVVFRIENENRNDERRDVWHFSSFTTAAAYLLNA